MDKRPATPQQLVPLFLSVVWLPHNTHATLSTGSRNLTSVDVVVCFVHRCQTFHQTAMEAAVVVTMAVAAAVAVVALAVVVAAMAVAGVAAMATTPLSVAAAFSGVAASGVAATAVAPMGATRRLAAHVGRTTTCRASSAQGTDVLPMALPHIGPWVQNR